MISKKQPVTQPPLIEYIPVLLVVFLLVFFGYRIFRNFDDVVEVREGRAVLKEERAEELEKKKKELREEYICYKLIALEDGIYPFGTHF